MFIGSVLCLFLCGLAACYLIWKKNSKYREQIERFPGPKTVPIFGNILQMVRGGAGMYGTILKFASESYKEEGLYRLWFGHNAAIVVYKPELLEEILSNSKNTKKSIFYKMAAPWLQDGLLLSHGPKWQRRRKQLTPTFHYSILESFICIFDTKASILVDILLDKKVEGEAFDIYSLMTNCALDIICDTAMGIDVKAQEDGNSDYIHALHRISDIIMDRMKSLWKSNDFLFSLSSLGREHKQVLNVLHGFTKKVIEERWNEFHARKKSEQESKTHTTPSLDDEILDDRSKVKRQAFLDLLLASNADNDLTLDELRAEVDTFMFEGHDTTAASLTWAVYCLAVNKDCQQRARQEIEDTFGNDKLIDMSKLKELKYLECCIKESSRILPPVPFYGRETTHECKMGGNDVPIGTSIFLIPAMTHRDPRYFPNPEEYLPDRWLIDDVGARHPFAYIPFSAGPRNCIGQKFAMLEQKVVLSSILRKFDISCDQTLSEIDPQGLLVLRPAVGVFITLNRISDVI